MLPYVRNHVNVPAERTIDPTLLLTADDYDKLATEREYDFPYLLLYTRRYNAKMEAYAERLAKEKGMKIVEISLRATNAEKGHIMRYDAGVEEFLSIVKHSAFVVTNSFHGLIFAVQYCRPMAVFTREQAGSKINEVLDLMNLKDTQFITGDEEYKGIDYADVHQRIGAARELSLAFLNKELELL